MTPVFVTVDPERDGPAEVKEYAGYFHPALVGLTGSPEQVAQIARQWRVFYRKVDVEGGGYTVDHSSFMYLMGPDGELDALLRYGTPPEEIAAAIRNAIAEGGGAGT